MNFISEFPFLTVLYVLYSTVLTNPSLPFLLEDRLLIIAEMYLLNKVMIQLVQ